MKRLKTAAVLLSAAIGLCALAGCRNPIPPSPPELRDGATVTVFTTNDIHGNVAAGEKAVGIAQAAAIKASTENALLIDAGDATQGASFASISRGADVIRMMNEAGYDLMAAGNHEFDYGAEVLLENKQLASFPVLAANVLKDGKPLLESSAVLTVAEYKIGFVGLTTVSTATSTNLTLLSGVVFADEIKTAKEQIALLKDETDAIVLVCHLGDNDKAVSCTSKQLLEGLSEEERAEVAAVIDGHSHTVEEETFRPQGGESGAQQAKAIPILQTGVNFGGLGKLTLTFRDGENGASVSAEGEVLDCGEAAAYPLTEAGEEKSRKVGEALAAVQGEQSKILDEFLCTLDHPLFGGYVCHDYVESRVVETAYGDFVTDAFRYYAEAFAKQNGLQTEIPVIAVENGGGISQSLPTWYTSGTDVTVGDVMNAFNHGNLVEVLLVSPAELFAALESGLATTGQDDTGLLLRERVSGSFLQVSGFSYTYDPAGKTGSKVVEVKLADGTLLDRNDGKNRLLLATNSYVPSSFEKAEKLGELGGEDIVLMDYIALTAHENDGVLDYDCAYDRIRIANDKSPETYEVKLRAMNGDAPKTNATLHLMIDGDGETEVTTDGDGYFTVTLTKGAHYLQLEESENFVYVNNYSGTGTVDTEEGYYIFEFTNFFASKEIS